MATTTHQPCPDCGQEIRSINLTPYVGPCPQCGEEVAFGESGYVGVHDKGWLTCSFSMLRARWDGSKWTKPGLVEGEEIFPTEGMFANEMGQLRRMKALAHERSNADPDPYHPYK